ncbi:hypothetical protein DVA67_031055 [Solirubrobacter sp. CPCC 204708]|uniref:DUF2092 domain-containing protein n=1 Tax=Solirubrobacter deserti TaxID=2282478 RepID=A0ABT4RLG7_9ACTN|nr:hypothetical protein [Solirubrobacter deserti]MBE2320443.1 hypothetical protein [Solirubrobacter deserti]MDA0139366.1 hypothetical protein [Solirubrobacter deserti]
MSLDDLIQRADPIRDEPLDFDAAFDALREDIAAQPVVVRRRRRAPRKRLALPALALVAAAVAAVVFFAPGDHGTERAWADPLVKVAESVPRLLVGDWKVTRADQFEVGAGEMVFVDGSRKVELNWRGDGTLAGWVRDRAKVGPEQEPVEVQGTTARLFAYSEHDVTALWGQGDYVIEMRGNAVREALAALRTVSVDEWLGAMPASVVRPDDSDAVIDQMLVDINLPPGLDRSQLDTRGLPRDRYQLGARVVAAVACGWIELWLNGGEKERAEAVIELQSARSWTILKEMDREGDYPEVLFQYVDAVAGEGTVMGGKPLTVKETYKDALGC